MKGLSAISLTAAVVGGHYAYYSWPPGWERSWAQWVGLNVLIVVMAAFLIPQAGRLARFSTLALTACWLAIIESGQAAICSVKSWGSVPTSDLCIAAFGVWPYVVASAALAAMLITGKRK